MFDLQVRTEPASVWSRGEWRSLRPSDVALSYTPDIEHQDIRFCNAFECPFFDRGYAASSSTVIRMRRIDVDDVFVPGMADKIRGTFKVTHVATGQRSSAIATHGGLWVLPDLYKVDIAYADASGKERTQTREIDLR